jgi:hypothetical protein
MKLAMVLEHTRLEMTVVLQPNLQHGQGGFFIPSFFVHVTILLGVCRCDADTKMTVATHGQMC